MTLANSLTITGIRWYQRRLSPYKGFRCAHAAVSGGPSCSTAILEIVRAQGLVGGWPQVVTRFADCRLAYQGLRGAALLGGRGRSQVKGLCCCGPVPIPFRCG